jgi:ligand-binding sensor domain-containing protein
LNKEELVKEILDNVKKAALFFRNESVPMGVRVGVATAVCLIVTFPFWVNLGKKDPMKELITSDSFPTGPSGLADSSAKEDQAKAALVEYKEDSEDPVVAKNDATKPTEETKAEKSQANEADVPEPDRGPFKTLPLNLKVPRAIVEGIDKTIWLADKGGIFSFNQGKLSKGKLVMNSESYDAEFNSDLPALSTIYPTSDGSLWAGFTDGTLMHYHRYEWKHIRGKNKDTEDSITSFASADDKVFIGSKALYQWDNKYNQLLADPEWRGKWITALASSKDHGIFMASKTTMYKYDKSWQPFWEGSKQDGSISSINFGKDGNILLGTSGGLIRLSKKGVILERALIGEKVKSISSGENGTLWVGTRGNGLRYFDGENWYKAAAKEGLGDWTTEVLLDNQNRLWVGVTGAGVMIAKLSKATEWIKNYPDQDLGEAKPQLFKSACHAAESLINKVSYSGQIASRIIDGTRYVFFKGHQVCPEGIGYYRNDNSVIFLKDWNLIEFHDDKRKEISLAKEYPADKVNLVFYDSKNHIWLSTPDTGLSRYKTDKLEDLGLLKGNPVTSIIEAGDGVLWIGTTPPFDKEQNTYHQKNLHLFTESDSNTNFSSFDSRDGLKQNSTLALNQIPNGNTAIATRLGISVITPDKQVLSYDKDSGINFEHCADISYDKKGRIWTTHQYFGNGITWIDQNLVYSITKEQGLFSDKISKVAVDRTGNIWLLASNGEVGVYPRKYLEEKGQKKIIPERVIRSRPLGSTQNK